MFETDEYQQLLAALGYVPVAKAAWGKAIVVDQALDD
jgi:hypothetical protein